MEQYARLDECVAQATRATIHLDGESEEIDTTRPADVARIVQSRNIVETVSLGVAKSGTQVTIYDKTRELRASGKTWQAAHLRARGWDGVAPVTRIEAKFRAASLTEFASMGFDLRPLDALVRFDEWARELWSYATRKSVRYVVPSEGDTNRSRWRPREDWAWIQSLGELHRAPPARARVITPAQREERAKRASRSVIRGLVSLAAEHPDIARRVRHALGDIVREEQEASEARAAHVVREPRDVGTPELVLAASVFSVLGDLVGLRALGGRDAESRALTLCADIEKRRAWVVWANDYEAPLVGDREAARAA
jgi:hypothetical protein